MRIALAVLVILHGLVHWLGFAVPWRLARYEEMPYETTLLGGLIDVGDFGIRVVGILWLLAGLAFLAAGFGAFASQGWWPELAVAVAVFSLALCILGWPNARIGIGVNLAILALLFLGGRYGWFPDA